MTAAVERLRAAVARLEALKADSTPGPWKHWAEAGTIEIYSDWTDPAAPRWSEVVIVDRVRPRDGWGSPIYRDNYEPNAELIVTLHRTIDSQIAILNAAMRYFRHDPSLLPGVIASVDNAVALADAVLGGAE